MITLPPADEMYAAIRRRDPAFEGVFFTCVKTTGIFCRPTCKAKPAKRENVEFVATAQAALLAGYRPCKLCKPMSPAGAAPDWASALIDEVRRSPATRIPDASLRERGLNPATVRRFFQDRFGMTFHAYQRAVRLGEAFAELRAGADALPAGMRAGYDSDSGFREAFARLFGAAPTKANGVLRLCADWLETPLGAMVAIADDDGLCLLEFVDRRALEKEIETLRRRRQCVVIPGANDVLRQTRDEISEYFGGSRRDFTIPLSPLGTPFQRQVWEALREIPFAETMSYAALADRIGRPGASRAVGRANGMNTIAIIIPCHRVVGASGDLVGYGGGLWRKRRLLDLEHASLEREIAEHTEIVAA